MNTKILLVCEQFQKGEITALSNALTEAGKLLGINNTELKAMLKTDLIQEEIAGKEWPVAMTDDATCKQISRILAVGIVAYNKVEIFKDRVQVERIPQPRSWDDKMKADAAVTIARLLNGWNVVIDTPKPPPLPVPATAKKKQPGFFDPWTPEEKAAYDAKQAAATSSPAISSDACPIPDKAFEADLDALETMLKVEVSNSRLQACIFNWNKDGSTLEIKNASIINKVVLENLVPILVDDSVLKDEKKAKEVRDLLDKAGYKNPYLMPIREFTMLVRMYQHLAKERKLRLELVA